MTFISLGGLSKEKEKVKGEDQAESSVKPLPSAHSAYTCSLPISCPCGRSIFRASPPLSSQAKHFRHLPPMLILRNMAFPTFPLSLPLFFPLW